MSIAARDHLPGHVIDQVLAKKPAADTPWCRSAIARRAGWPARKIAN